MKTIFMILGFCALILPSMAYAETDNGYDGLISPEQDQKGRQPAELPGQDIYSYSQDSSEAEDKPDPAQENKAAADKINKAKEDANRKLEELRSTGQNGQAAEPTAPEGYAPSPNIAGQQKQLEDQALHEMEQAYGGGQ